jgi:prepilin-type N-terminal cleavage/methylation domain-containing protein
MLCKFILIDRSFKNRMINVDRIISNDDQKLCHTPVKPKEQGFSLLEVLITILVISSFLLGSLKATVLASLLRVQAEDRQEAINWTQKDLELMKYKAFILENNKNDCGNYAKRLEENLITSGFFREQNDLQINQKEYRIERNYISNGNILQINHIVKYDRDHPRYKNTASNNIATQLSTEVFPHVSLNC